uniref:Uncharacterized protein n=1 Tax=Arundo donax TaxID=35708 RepID=A0A0A9ALW1_ARUDO
MIWFNTFSVHYNMQSHSFFSVSIMNISCDHGIPGDDILNTDPIKQPPGAQYIPFLAVPSDHRCACHNILLRHCFK